MHLYLFLFIAAGQKKLLLSERDRNVTAIGTANTLGKKLV